MMIRKWHFACNKHAKMPTTYSLTTRSVDGTGRNSAHSNRSRSKRNEFIVHDTPRSVRRVERSLNIRGSLKGNSTNLVAHSVLIISMKIWCSECILNRPSSIRIEHQQIRDNVDCLRYRVAKQSSEIVAARWFQRLHPFKR